MVFSSIATLYMHRQSAYLIGRNRKVKTCNLMLFLEKITCIPVRLVHICGPVLLPHPCTGYSLHASVHVNLVALL